MNTRSSMGRMAAGGAAYMGMAQALRVVVTIVSTIIVARLLTPDDYGVMAMVAPVTAFLLMFQNLGLSQAAIQARTLSHQQSNALFWLNMAASAAITLVLLALSPVVAWFYGDARTGYVTAASAATVLLAGSTIQHMSLLHRELRFRTVAMIDIASAAVGLIATVAAAAMIRSYWALWLGGFVGVVAGRTLAWRASRWRPSLKISFAGSGQLIRFGGAITGFKLLNFLQRNLDTILIGRVWGSATLGLYDRSYKLMMFPLQNINAPLSRVLIPVLARLQDEPERFRRSFLLTLRCILLVSIPPIAVASATSERLVPLLLGDQWSGATPIFFWLCFVALFQPLTNTLGWLFIASGRGRALLHWGAFSALVTVAAFAVGIRWGAVGIAISYLISSAAKVPIVLPWAVRGTSVRTLDLYLTSTPYFASAAIIYLSVDWARPHFSILPLIFIAIPAAYTVACIFTCLSSNGRDAIRSLVRFGRSLLGARMVKSTIPQSGQY